MVTTQEAARVLCLSRRGVQSAIIRGRMHATKRGRQWFITEEEIERYRIFHMHTQASDARVDRGVHRRQRGGGWRRERGGVQE